MKAKAGARAKTLQRANGQRSNKCKVAGNYLPVNQKLPHSFAHVTIARIGSFNLSARWAVVVVVVVFVVVVLVVERRGRVWGASICLLGVSFLPAFLLGGVLVSVDGERAYLRFATIRPIAWLALAELRLG